MHKEAETDREIMIESNLEQVQAGTEVAKRLSSLLNSLRADTIELHYHATLTDQSWQRKALHNNSNMNPSHMPLTQNK